MPTYAVTYTYRSDSHAARDEARPAHVEHLQALFDDGSLRLSGPTGDVGTPGALLIVEAESEQAVATLLDGDPFFSEGLLDREIREWRLFFGIDRLSAC